MTNTPTKTIHTIDALTLEKLLRKGDVTLIDVRELDEYRSERIEGSKLFPLSTFDLEKLPLEGNKPFVLTCRSANRSGQAAQRLLAAGYTEVTHLQGGLNAWKEAGLPIKKQSNAPISLMRQVHIVAGSLVVAGILLGFLVAPGFFVLSGIVGCGLLFSGISDNCMMANLLAKLPYNQVNS
jgi:rhodanese-related sulfurtransferase